MDITLAQATALARQDGRTRLQYTNQHLRAIPVEAEDRNAKKAGKEVGREKKINKNPNPLDFKAYFVLVKLKNKSSLILTN